MHLGKRERALLQAIRDGGGEVRGDFRPGGTGPLYPWDGPKESLIRKGLLAVRQGTASYGYPLPPTLHLTPAGKSWPNPADT